MAKQVRKRAHRIYDFPLPHTISGMQAHFGEGQLAAAGILGALPIDLQIKFHEAAQGWQPLTVTRSDIDRIPDEAWTVIATKLGLQWRKA